MSNEDKRPKRKLTRKERRLKKKQKRLYYRVLTQKKKPSPVIYSLEIFFSVILEVFRVSFKTLCVFAVIGVAIGIFLFKQNIEPTLKGYYTEAQEIVSESSPDDFKLSESSVIYDSKGKEIASLHENSDLVYLDYDEIPEDVINAFIAVEDRTFWTNKGVDLKGITRILINYLKTNGAEKHGASTITQQLARNVYLTHEVSMERKLKEIFISLELNDKYSKNEIMEYYVNDICFANGIYGIGGASRAYFDKEVDKLSLSQLVYLCSIPNSPEYYNPYKYPERALARRDKILDDMLEQGYITKTECDNAKDEKIKIKKPKYAFNNYETTYATDCAVRYLMELDGFIFRYKFDDSDDYSSYKSDYDEAYSVAKHKLYTKGYKIYTSLNSKLCNKLQKVVDNQLAFSIEKSNTGEYALQGALTCINNKTGKVVAIVGGRSQKDSSNIYSLNRAYQSPRQPGSSFKPLAVYTPILETGYDANTMVEDIDVSVAKQSGINVQSLYGTRMTLRSAVEKSRNGVAWKLFDKLTPKKGLSYVEKMQFASLCSNDYYNSASLGGLTNGATTVEMASAYSTLASHGKFTEPTCITSIKDKDGNEIYKKSKKKRVYTSKAADDMVDILKGVLIRGTASGLSWSSSSDIEAFAKTGTTNDSKDGWLCGATPYYSISVWVGYDTPRTLNNLYGATYPGNIWKEAMLIATKGKDKATFTRDSNDKSYKESKTQVSKGYYGYLEGRSDSEVLSSGYTVADYRNDRVIGESVYEVIAKINDLDMSKSDSKDKLEELYNGGLGIIDTIYSVKYTAEMKGYLNSAYNSKK